MFDFTSALRESRGSLAAGASLRDGGVVHVCNGFDAVRDGGFAPSVLGMAGAVAALGELPTAIVTTTPSRPERLSVPAGVALHGPEVSLERAIAAAAVVHLHGLWQAPTRVGSRLASRHRVPYLVAAHGMADPWALRHKAWKKRLYLAMVERHALRGAACLHALTRSEARFLRELAPSTPVACVPNGVDLRPLDDLPSRHSVEATYPELAGKFTLLFLGRLHAKKGLDVLADALVRAWGTHDDWHLLLAGPEDGAGAPFLRRMSMLGLRGHVTVVGHVSGETTRRMWGAADAFVLPSRSEGFSMTVLESLAARVPPIVTTACHFPELAEVGAGLVCEPDAESLAEALHTLRFERTAEDRARCGERGRALVEQQFTWETQARRLVQVYRWLADRGPRPDVVEG